MKILLLSSERGWRGGEVHIFCLAEYLRQYGVEVTIVCRKNSESHKHCISNNFSYINAGQKNVFDLLSAWKIYRFCKKNRVDIIHAHSSKSFGVAVLAAFIFNFQAKIIFTKHTVFPISKTFLTWLRYNNKYLKAAIGVSEVVCKQLKAIILNESKVVKVLNSVTVNLVEPLSKEKMGLGNYIVLGTCSALTAEKNITLFIDILAELNKLSIPFKAIVIGDGADRNKLEEYAKKQGVESEIIFTGFHSNSSDMINALDIFVQTSTLEGFGLSLLEAFTLGKVCVTTNVGAAKEIITQGVDGFVVDSFDKHEFVSTIKALANNPDRMMEVGAAAKIASQSFSVSKMAENTIDVYRKVLKECSLRD